MFGWQVGPEKEMGPTRNTEPDGTTMVAPSVLQAATHAASNACMIMWCQITFMDRKFKSGSWNN